MDCQLQLLDKGGIVDPWSQREQVSARGSGREKGFITSSTVFKDPPGIIQVDRAQRHLQQTIVADLNGSVVLAPPDRKRLRG